jgi:hypothetical protein
LKQPGFRWITRGGILAVVLWVTVSAAFAFFVANFGFLQQDWALAGRDHLSGMALDIEHRDTAPCRIQRGTRTRAK